MQVSRVMIVGWLTLILGVLGVPGLTDVLPVTWMPYVAMTAGILTVLIRWLSGGFGMNPLSVVGVLTFVAGLLGVPELLAVIPAAWMPYVAMVASICTLLARFQAGQSLNEKTAMPVGFLLHKSEGN